MRCGTMCWAELLTITAGLEVRAALECWLPRREKKMPAMVAITRKRTPITIPMIAPVDKAEFAGASPAVTAETADKHVLPGHGDCPAPQPHCAAPTPCVEECVLEAEATGKDEGVCVAVCEGVLVRDSVGESLPVEDALAR